MEESEYIKLFYTYVQQIAKNLLQFSHTVAWQMGTGRERRWAAATCETQ